MTATIELKLTQDFSSVEQYPLFLVLLFLRKAYDNLYHWWQLQTLTGCRAVQKLWILLAEILSLQESFTCQNVLNGPQLIATRGTTHWGFNPTTLFNVAVDNVV